MKENVIIIIGGGVSGITTALTLQLLGFDTTVIAEHLVDDEAPDDPRFASLYPAASVIPHSVQSSRLASLFTDSLVIFKHLFEEEFEHVDKHRHFELFEFPRTLPDYTRHLHNFSPIDKCRDEPIPRRTDAPKLHGWVFDCFVAEWPDYMQQLYTLYRQSGGTIRREKIERNQISTLPADVIINCSGIWSVDLFSDATEQQIVRGHLVHALNMKAVSNKAGLPCSYNYTPRKEVYATPQNKSSDVYFYPIKNRWVLGGSRQIGSLDGKGNWSGDTHHRNIHIGDVDVPRPVIELNKNILQNTFGVHLKSGNHLKAQVGYRHSRGNKEHGLRLEKDVAHRKTIIHNYGHGGAGVTLSWGCALQVLRLLADDDIRGKIRGAQKSPVLKSLQVKLQKVYLN
jgi:glycine/D-amino acid oxidase-like deaminating enzyme